MKKIWVKIFKSNNKTYCYDVGTNHIMEIDEILGKVLEKYNYTNETEILSDFGNLYGEKLVKTALNTINEFNKNNNGFILERQISLRFPFKKNDYKLLLDNFLNQMVLNLTQECNYRCTYCSYGDSYIYTRKHSNRSMPWETIKEAIDFYLPKTVEYLKNVKKKIGIGFYGGEALIEKNNIFKGIDYIQYNYREFFPNITFSLTTNGSLLSREMIQNLVEYNFSLTISLDGPKEIHDRYRVLENGRGTFDIILKNLNWLKETYPNYFKTNVRFNAVMAPEFKIKEMRNFFLYNFPDQNLSVAPINPFDTTFCDNFDMKKTLEEYDRDIHEIREGYINSQKNGKITTDSSLFEFFLYEYYNRELYKLPQEIYPNGICAPAIRRIFVEVDGSINICERINSGFEIGDIKNGFNIDRIFELIKSYIEITENCVGCWAVRLCKECFISAIKGNRFDMDRKNSNCAIRREKTLDEIKFFTKVMEECPGILDNIHYTSPEADMIKIGNDFLQRQAEAKK